MTADQILAGSPLSAELMPEPEVRSPKTLWEVVGQPGAEAFTTAALDAGHAATAAAPPSHNGDDAMRSSAKSTFLSRPRDKYSTRW
mmetsp:Transcript_93819/g.169446  ORF Transcript_93819/g.169446 Transcript_93819/m.169446 type:complete len:86 (-) Transcript_93819:386-643(-)